MTINPDFISPCGLYCGVCAIHIADRDNNNKLKERLLGLYKGKISGKGILPNSENLTVNDIKCSGCLSGNLFMHCKQCDIKNCTKEKGYKGCYQCDEFPCKHIDNFPMTIGKKVILRSVPYIRKYGIKKWVKDEETRYLCPQCKNRVFRGAVRCNKCKISLDLD